jgi:uncharacterized protein (DUF4415 family)
MSESKRALGSDLAKVDAHVIGPEEYDEAPEWTDEMFDRATWAIGGKSIPTPPKRGRPKAERPKKLVTLRLDQDVLDHFRATGAGWQARLNAALRAVVDR